MTEVHVGLGDAFKQGITHEVAYDPTTNTGLAYGPITPEVITTAIEGVIARVDERLERITTSQDLTWESTMGLLNEAWADDEHVSNHVRLMALVHSDKGVRDAAVAAETKNNHHSNDVQYRADVYQKIKAYAQTAEAQALTGEEARSLARRLLEYRRLGHELRPDARARMQELSACLLENATEFSRNLREDNTVLPLTARELAGTSESYLASLEQDVDGKYVVTMQYPHVIPLLMKASNRETRRRVSEAFNTQVVAPNRALLEDTIAKRQEIAAIMGYPSWAHYKLEERMAQTPEAVKDFYAELIGPLSAKAEAELAVMADMLHADGHEGPVRKYDTAYYGAIIRERDHGVDQEKLAEYLPLNACLEGLFAITGETFGLRYRKLDVPAWHEDVEAYAIDDAETGEQRATFYMDLFPRDGKFKHAAVYPLRKGCELPDGTYQQPESALVTNFTKPTADKPALLRHRELRTLFHEFGHVLHQSLTRARLPQFAGTRVERDFVEAPSQIMENWVERPEILQRFARHYKTGDALPVEIIEGLVESQQVNIALGTLDQISYGYMDMAMHDESAYKDLDEILLNGSAITMVPHEQGTFFLARFGHILNGYDAGYYGYEWASVYGDDMFGRFEREGLTNPAVGRDYRRKILEPGGTIDAIDMLRAFLGREPNNLAFLKGKGISVE